MHAESTIDQELAGLDRLESVVEERESRWLRLWHATWPKVAAVLVVVGIWQWAVWREWKPIYVLPSPRMVWDRLWADLGTAELWEAIFTTMQRALIGYGLAVLIGGAIGLAVTASRHLRTAIGALITGLQTMPSIAWFPLAILLMGLTEKAIMFVVVLGAAPSIANGVIHGIDSSPPLLRRLAGSMQANRRELYRDFLVPAAMPSVVAGLKQGWAFAWRSLMAGELLVLIPGTQSVGGRLQFAREFQDSEGVMSMMVVILVLGILMDALVFSRIERRVLRKRGLGAHR